MEAVQYSSRYSTVLVPIVPRENGWYGTNTMKVYHLPVPTVPYESCTKCRRNVLKSGDNGVPTGVFRASRDLPRQKRSQVRPQHKRRGSKLDKRV